MSESTELPVSFLTPLADLHVYEKDKAKFELEISREPKSFRWLKGSQELSNDDKFELVLEGKRHALIVKSAKYEDEGRYMFEAEDKRTSGKLFIKGKSISLTAAHLTFLQHPPLDKLCTATHAMLYVLHVGALMNIYIYIYIYK